MPPSRDDNRTPVHGAMSIQAKMSLLDVGQSASSTSLEEAKGKSSSVRRFIEHRVSEKEKQILFKSTITNPKRRKERYYPQLPLIPKRRNLEGGADKRRA